MRISASRLIVVFAALSIIGSPINVGIGDICLPANAKDPTADSLYDLAKSNFDGGNLAEAESLMRQSLQLEKTMKRPQALVRTEIALATILVSAHRAAEAKQLFEEALAFANEHKLRQETISIAINLGAIAMQDGAYDQARKLYQQALADSQAQGLAAAQANALINLSVLERAQNHLQEAMSCLNQALPLLGSEGSETQVGNLLMEIARVQADLGKHDEAIASYHKAKEHFAQDFDNVSQGKALMAAGQVLLTQEKYADATRELTDAIKILTPEDGSTPSNTLADCLISLAAVHTAEKQFAQSESTLKQALTIADTLKSADRKRAALSELGYLMLVRGLTEQALEKYLQAYDLLPKTSQKPSKTRAVLLIDLAMCYKALGQMDQAIKSYEQALAILASVGDVQAQALAANNLAVAYLDSGKTKDFDRLWQQASTLFAQAHDKKGQAIMSYNLGQSKLVGKKFAEAVGDYQQALTLMRAARDANGIGQSLRGLGLAYLLNAQVNAQGNQAPVNQAESTQLHQAIDCYQEALKLAEQKQSGEANTEAKWDCHLGLGKAYKKLGDKEQALDHLRQAVSIGEQERSQLSRDTFKTFNLDMRQDCFYELVDLLIQQNQAEEALEIAERSRARAFADLLAAREQTISHKLDNPGSSTLNSAPLPALSSFQQAQDFSVESNVVSQTLSASQLKQLAQEHGATILEYYALPEKLLVWLIDSNGTVHLLPAQNISLSKLTAKTAELYNVVIAQPKTLEEIKQSGTLRQAKLKEMYKLLISPAEPLLQTTKKVVIVPHGPLFLVPFAALMNAQGKFLVESYTLTFTPAISVLQSTAKLANAALQGNSLLAFGNPKTEIFAELGSLPYAEKEVQKAAELFGKTNTTMELGEQANKSSFIQFAPKTSVIHMACHGIINEEHPTMSGLVLAKNGKDNGFLPVKDILNLPPLKSRLVVLSACQTGRGKITGDGVIGLSRAFIAAGTPSVIVSQWNVDDVIAEYQMEAFYKTLLSGKNKAESLREAQVKTIASMEGTQADTTSPTFIRANPRYWAAFQLIGEAQ
jgi:CHAT domain-containing protein/Tfp pilus assembly protein PilF